MKSRWWIIPEPAKDPVARNRCSHSGLHRSAWLGLSILMVAAGLGLAGCARSRASFYPLGIYGVPSTDEFPLIRAMGINVIVGPASRSYLDAAQRAGLKVLASPDTSAGPRFDGEAARQAVGRGDRHPALWAWYLADEPDLNRVAPETIVQAHRFFKRLPARHPTALVLSQGAAALHYANIADITMIDRYPIAWLPLANLGQHVRMTRLALGPKKPLMAVIQCFDWSAYPELLPIPEPQRAPTYEELRCLVYSALAERADGLFFYAFNAGRWQLREHAESRVALEKVLAEITARQSLFQAEHRWWPYAHIYAPWQAGYNAALQSSITPALLRVRRSHPLLAPGDYVLAVNNTDRPVDYRFSLPWPVTKPIPVLDEDRVLEQDGRWATDQFAPYAVHVYGPLPAEEKRPG